jgi:hypothetical protein
VDLLGLDVIQVIPLFHQLRPDPSGRAELGDLLEIILVD